MSTESLKALRKELKQDTEVRARIAARAYEIYERRGHQPGNPEEDWYQAENEIIEKLVAEKNAGEKPPKGKAAHQPQIRSAAEHAVEKPAPEIGRNSPPPAEAPAKTGTRTKTASPARPKSAEPAEKAAAPKSKKTTAASGTARKAAGTATKPKTTRRKSSDKSADVTDNLK